MEKTKKLSFYLLRWQLSTPILYLVMTCVDLPDLQKTVLANFIGALVFFPVDELIFKK
ncbi:MAG: hypothetical protein WCQ96_02840 [Patescibacteria group bacterium]